MPGDNSITLSKSDPQIADMFSACKPGDQIQVSLGYEGKTANLTITVGEDDEANLSGTIDEVSMADAGDAGKVEGEETGEAPGGGTVIEEETEPEVDTKTPAGPAGYINSMRKKARK